MAKYSHLKQIRFRRFMDLYDILEERGYIGYGKTIHISTLEDLIGHENNGSWNFRGPYLTLRTRLEKNGFFTSSRNQGDGSIYILPKRNMSKEFHKKRKKRLKKDRIQFESVNNLDVDDLDEQSQREHYHELSKAINYINSAKSILDKYLD